MDSTQPLTWRGNHHQCQLFSPLVFYPTCRPSTGDWKLFSAVNLGFSACLLSIQQSWDWAFHKALPWRSCCEHRVLETTHGFWPILLVLTSRLVQVRLVSTGIAARLNHEFCSRPFFSSLAVVRVGLDLEKSKPAHPRQLDWWASKRYKKATILGTMRGSLNAGSVVTIKLKWLQSQSDWNTLNLYCFPFGDSCLFLGFYVRLSISSRHNKQHPH